MLGVRAVSTMAAITVPIMVLATLLLYPFMVLWVGHGFAIQASPVGEILLLGTWTSSMAFVPYALLQAQGRPRTVALLHVAEAPFMIAAVWIGVHYYGLVGAAWAILGRTSLDCLAFFILAGMLRDVAHRLFRAAAWIVVALVVARLVGNSFSYHIVASIIFFAASCVWAIQAERTAKHGLWLLGRYLGGSALAHMGE